MVHLASIDIPVALWKVLCKTQNKLFADS